MYVTPKGFKIEFENKTTPKDLKVITPGRKNQLTLTDNDIIDRFGLRVASQQSGLIYMQLLSGFLFFLFFFFLLVKQLY